MKTWWIEHNQILLNTNSLGLALNIARPELIKSGIKSYTLSYIPPLPGPFIFQLTINSINPSNYAWGPGLMLYAKTVEQSMKQRWAADSCFMTYTATNAVRGKGYLFEI